MSNFICFPTPPSCNDLKLGKFFSGKTDFEPSLPFVTVLQSILYSIINQELFQETDRFCLQSVAFMDYSISIFFFWKKGKHKHFKFVSLSIFERK